MLTSDTRRRIAALLDDSAVRQIIVEELSAVCHQKPPDMTIEVFGHEVARLILLSLHEQLRDECDRQLGRERAMRAIDRTTPPDHPIDFEFVLNGLMLGMEHDLLVGNLQMIRALGGAIAQRDTGTDEHNARVTLYAHSLGQKAGFGSERLQALLKGSFVHDIGKIGIRDGILLKVDRLSEKELATMHSHAVLGCRIIKGVRWLADAYDVVRHHHERYDGLGYPDGLSGESIPITARAFAIADVFDALTSERAYKPALSCEQALIQMEAERGRHFDPDLLDIFLQIATDLCESIVARPLAELDNMVVEVITRVFGVNPSSEYVATDEFKQRYSGH
ncbi:MAG: HD domain-containing phosphohydrolase [candidate division Zixibacteria bacterium]|jgi:HD-GYP domain-containing protein (c-di-GMP phosphodiesterase class II)|nr:HD domain-containing phosphohydrolase [candidate division Zixibacteria bacterium]